MPDGYPVTLAPQVRSKLRVIHTVILDQHNSKVEAEAGADAVTGDEDSIVI